MATETLSSGVTMGIDPAEVEDGEIVDSDDEASANESTAKSDLPEGPAFAEIPLGSKRPFETIWGSHSSVKRTVLPSGSDEGEEGEVISDEEVDDSDRHSGDDPMDYGKPLPSASSDYHSSHRYDSSTYRYSHSPPHTSPPHYSSPHHSSSHHSPTHHSSLRHSPPHHSSVSTSKHSSRSSGSVSSRNSSLGSSRRSVRGGGVSRKHGSKKEPKAHSRRHTDLPPATDPFWGVFKVLLPTPDITPIEGRDLELDYPPLPDELAEEYGLNYVRIFVNDMGQGSTREGKKISHEKDSHTSSANFGTRMETHDANSSERDVVDSKEVDPLQDDYPLLSREQESEQSLKDLVLGAKNDRIDDERPDPSGARKVSLKKKLKSIEWHKRQQEKIKMSKSTQPCRFHIHGNCRAGDECTFSHDVPQEKKKREICKYHLTDSCTKGNECTYYHGPIPCKYHNSPTGCYRGDQCRFSHDPLTGETEDILQQVLKMDKQKKQQAPPLGSSAGYPPSDHPPRVKQPLLPTPPHLLAELSERGIIPPQPRMSYFSDVDPQTDPYQSPRPTHFATPPPADTVSSLPSLMSVEPASVDPRSSRGKPEEPIREGNFPQSCDVDMPVEQPPPLFQGIPPLMQQPVTQSTPPASTHSSAPPDPRKPHERPTPRQSELAEPLYAEQSSSPEQPPPDKPRSGASKYPHLRVRKKNSPRDFIPLSVDSREDNPGQKVPQEDPRRRQEIFQMPKSLHDSSSLDKPLDPVALFGNASQDTPTQGQDHDNLYTSKPKYGEILLPRQPTGVVKETNTATNQMPQDNEHTADTPESQEDDATTVPYYAMFDTGLGGDELEIDSAFGTLS